MSWRIAVNEHVDMLAGQSSDFVIGKDGTVEDCVQASWSEGPLRVRFCDEADFVAFLREWATFRDVADLASAWRLRPDGAPERVEHFHEITSRLFSGHAEMRCR